MSVKLLHFMQKKHRTILFILITLLVIVGILRELGYVDISKYTAKWHSEISHNTQAVQYSAPLKIPSSGVFVVSRIESIFALAMKDELKRQIDAKPNFYISISLNQFDVEGQYWLPLSKKGRCIYQLQVRVVEGNGNTVKDSSISGEMDFNIAGVCSILKFKQVLAAKIVEEVIKYIEQ